MKSICLPYFAFISAAMSTTGPHTRDWHSCGVANTSATGCFPSTLANEDPCMSSGGWRVSIFDTSPFAEATVSVCTAGRPLAPLGKRVALWVAQFGFGGAATVLPFQVLAL